MSHTTAQAVANEFLRLSQKEQGTGLTNLQIQKLVYIAYGFYSYFKSESLFAERIEAWQHGPVIPALYYEAKNYEAKGITSGEIGAEFKFHNSKEVEKYDEKTGFPILEYFPSELEDSDAKKIVEFVWKSYGKISGWNLRELTHRQSSPWHQIYNNDGAFQEIRFDIIKKYYDLFVPALYQRLKDAK